MISSLNSSVVDSAPHEELSYLELRRLNYPEWAHQFVGFFLLVLGGAGFFLNTGVLFTFFKNKRLWSPTNTYIIGLSISDLSMIILAFPFSIANGIKGKWFTGMVTCIMEGFFVYGFGMVACHLLTFISIDRYIAIVKPMSAHMVSQPVAVGIVIISFIGGFMWAIFPFFGWSSYGLEAPGVSCGLDYEDQSVATQTYLIAIFIFAFLLPIAIMSFCYLRIYLIVRKIRKGIVDKETKEAKKHLKVERKMLKSTILMCGAFWFCWIPYAVATFWAAFGDPNDVPLVVTAIPAAAAKTEVVWNPLIYVGTNRKFRRAFYEFIPCFGVRQKLIEIDERRNESTKISKFTDEDDSKKPSNCQLKIKVIEVKGAPEASRISVGDKDTKDVDNKTLNNNGQSLADDTVKNG